MKFIGCLLVLTILVWNIDCTTNKSPVKSTTSQKVICYFTNWAVHRDGKAKFLPENIDSNLCTHIVYAYAALDPMTLTIKSSNPKIDINDEFYKRVTHLRQKGIKVLISMGGLSDSAGNKYDRLLTDANASRDFIASVMEFIHQHNFDGLDMEYPTNWQEKSELLRAQVKQGFAQLIHDISESFKPNGWLLSTTILTTDAVAVDAGYEIPQLNHYLDWISLMAYDLGSFTGETGSTSSLDNLDIESTVKYWIKKGISPKNLILGISSAGQLYKLENPENHDFNSKKSLSNGLGDAVSTTPGSLAYYEICHNIKHNKWTVVHDPKNKLGSYAYHGNQWVSFDDVENTHAKARLVRDMKLGGGMFWTLDFDDFPGTCGCGKYPLLSAWNQEIRNIGGKPVSNCT